MPETTSTERPSLPEGSLLAAVRTSCTAVIERNLSNEHEHASVDISVTNATNDKELSTNESPTTEEVKAPALLPLRFDKLEDELTVYTLLELVQEELTSYISILQSSIERSAEDTALFGVMSLYIGDQQLTAQRMASISLSDISSYFGLPLQHEVQHPTMSFVTVGERAPTWICAESVRNLINATSSTVLAAGFSSIGAAVKAAAERAHAQDAPTDDTSATDRFIRELISLIPEFNDATIVRGEVVYYYAAAQRLALRLRHLFDDPTEHNGMFYFDKNALHTTLHSIQLAQRIIQIQRSSSDVTVNESEVPLS